MARGISQGPPAPMHVQDHVLRLIRKLGPQVAADLLGIGYQAAMRVALGCTVQRATVKQCLEAMKEIGT